MDKKITGKVLKDSPVPAAVPPLHTNALPAIEVEQVLEHISSPYRWELLEVPDDKSRKSGLAKKQKG